MPIPESQLETWSHQGSVAQSSATYATFKSVLEASDTPYAGKNFKVFLQGSYGNDTNIWADSDVDIVICLSSTFFDTTEKLPEDQKALYKQNWSAATYTYEQFKTDVIAQLRRHFGDDVKPGKKAIFIQGNANRRDADVLVAVQYRKYTHFRSWADQGFIEGITFFTSGGQQIINYPKQHSANCTAKHQQTSAWLKPTVRMLKNMRNAMIAKGYIAEGIAPSYFLEGLLYNVPVDKFGRSYGDTFAASINWITNTDRSEFVCANEQYFLCHPTSPVTWRTEHLQTYLDAVTKFWREY